MKKLIAKRLKELRNEQGYSTEMVAKLLKDKGVLISPNTLYNYENGVSQPKADMFMYLCEIYHVSDFDKFIDPRHERMQTISDAPECYTMLNSEGKRKADDYIKDLLVNPKYTREGAPTPSISGTIAEDIRKIQSLRIPTH